LKSQNFLAIQNLLQTTYTAVFWNGQTVCKKNIDHSHMADILTQTTKHELKMQATSALAEIQPENTRQ
jgi:predicted phage-related endonuclease